MRTIAAGFLLVTRTPRRDFMDASLVPPTFVTTSACLATTAPGTWGIGWTNDSAEERAARGAALGLAGPSLVMGWGERCVVLSGPRSVAALLATHTSRAVSRPLSTPRARGGSARAVR